MFHWYREAAKCYVYLSDVRRHVGVDVHRTLVASRWFKRGWTLQELLAPKVVEFYSRGGEFLGSKDDLGGRISAITGIPLEALCGTPLSRFPVEKRMEWMVGRRTKRREDMAYCLLGIFDVSMPLIYGERDKAFLRLREEITKTQHGLWKRRETDWNGAPYSITEGFRQAYNARPASPTFSQAMNASETDKSPRTIELRGRERSRSRQLRARGYSSSSIGQTGAIPYKSRSTSRTRQTQTRAMPYNTRSLSRELMAVESRPARSLEGSYTIDWDEHPFSKRPPAPSPIDDTTLLGSSRVCSDEPRCNYDSEDRHYADRQETNTKLSSGMAYEEPRRTNLQLPSALHDSDRYASRLRSPRSGSFTEQGPEVLEPRAITSTTIGSSKSRQRKKEQKLMEELHRRRILELRRPG